MYLARVTHLLRLAVLLLLLVTGGLAADEGLTACVGEALDKLKLGTVEIRTHPDSVHAGAIGAALWGAYRHERLTDLAA